MLQISMKTIIFITCKFLLCICVHKNINVVNHKFEKHSTAALKLCTSTTKL